MLTSNAFLGHTITAAGLMHVALHRFSQSSEPKYPGRNISVSGRAFMRSSNFNGILISRHPRIKDRMFFIVSVLMYTETLECINEIPEGILAMLHSQSPHAKSLLLTDTTSNLCCTKNTQEKLHSLALLLYCVKSWLIHNYRQHTLGHNPKNTLINFKVTRPSPIKF